MPDTKPSLHLLILVAVLAIQTPHGYAQSLAPAPDVALPQPHADGPFGTCLTQVSSTGRKSQVGGESLNSIDSSAGQAQRENSLFQLAMPGILEEHAFMEYLMWRKHLYGTIFGDPPPKNNPLLTTQKELSAYLDAVVQTAAPGGILVYWRSRPAHAFASDLCVGLVLPGQRMLVEASPAPNAENLQTLLAFDRVTDARVAIPRNTPAIGLSTNQPPMPMDLPMLSKTLLPPTIASAFEQRRVKSLLIVPIEDIGGVPFAALPIRDKSTLIDYTTVTVAPGFDGLAGLGSSDITISSKDRTLIVGDPDLTANSQWIFPPLPGARLEARQVASFFGQQPLLGKAATSQAVLTKVAVRPTPRLIYFATHAIADPVNPQDGSFLALTGANLRTREIGKMKLTGHPLVVLSACQTGLGKVFDQGGIFGMALAWHYAGAGAVVMSLWNVPDLSTRDLMTEFSRLLQVQLPAEALANSMLTLRQHDSDPRDWAGFTVYGGLPLRPKGAQGFADLPTSQRPSLAQTQRARAK